MEIDKIELHRLYMEWVNEVADENEVADVNEVAYKYVQICTNMYKYAIKLLKKLKLMITFLTA